MKFTNFNPVSLKCQQCIKKNPNFSKIKLSTIQSLQHSATQANHNPQWNRHSQTRLTIKTQQQRFYLACNCTNSLILAFVFSLSVEYSSAISTFKGSEKSQRSVNIELIPNMTSFSLRVGSQLVPSIELSLNKLRQTSPFPEN